MDDYRNMIKSDIDDMQQIIDMRVIQSEINDYEIILIEDGNNNCDAKQLRERIKQLQVKLEQVKAGNNDPL